MGTINASTAYINQQLSDFRITEEGGMAIRLTNLTGANTIKGTLVNVGDNGFTVETSEFDSIGVVYEDGIADGQDAWIVVSGVVEILLVDATASTAGNWVFADAVDGRANASLALPPGGTISALENHFKEVGHCMETKIAGTDVLCKIALHFN